jgi:hypothetical protein
MLVFVATFEHYAMKARSTWLSFTSKFSRCL